MLVSCTGQQPKCCDHDEGTVSNTLFCRGVHGVSLQYPKLSGSLESIQICLVVNHNRLQHNNTESKLLRVWNNNCHD